jgi:hypothetical protein
MHFGQCFCVGNSLAAWTEHQRLYRIANNLADVYLKRCIVIWETGTVMPHARVGRGSRRKCWMSHTIAEWWGNRARDSAQSGPRTFLGQNKIFRPQSLLQIHHHLRSCPLYSGFPSPKTKFRHLSLSLVSSSVSPWFVMLRLTPSLFGSSPSSRSLWLPF